MNKLYLFTTLWVIIKTILEIEIYKMTLSIQKMGKQKFLSVYAILRSPLKQMVGKMYICCPKSWSHRCLPRWRHGHWLIWSLAFISDHLRQHFIIDYYWVQTFVHFCAYILDSYKYSKIISRSPSCQGHSYHDRDWESENEMSSYNNGAAFLVWLRNYFQTYLREQNIKTVSQSLNMIFKRKLYYEYINVLFNKLYIIITHLIKYWQYKKIHLLVQVSLNFISWFIWTNFLCSIFK